jgi:hypothetical protein
MIRKFEIHPYNPEDDGIRFRCDAGGWWWVYLEPRRTLTVKSMTDPNPRELTISQLAAELGGSDGRNIPLTTPITIHVTRSVKINGGGNRVYSDKVDVILQK